MNQPLRILHLEDEIIDFEISQITLAKSGLDCVIERAETRAAFETALAERPIDVILADYALPTFDGMAALRIARERYPAIPFIFLSGTLGEEVAITALQQGATDYVLKQRMDRLAPAVRRALREVEQRVERARAEAALRASERRFAQAFQANPSPMSITRFRDGCYLDVNERWLDLRGYTREEVIGSSPTMLKTWAKPQDRSDFLAQLRQTRSVRDLEYSFRSKSGSLSIERVSAELIELDGEECILLTTQDVTEKKLLEDQLRQAQKMEAVGRLAGGIAHDFNNLLTTILGYSTFLIEEFNPDHPCYRDIDEIRKAGGRAAALTQQLLAFSRKQVISPQIIDLNTIVAAMNKLLARVIGEDIDLRVNLAASLGRVQADPGQIEQVIMNLAVNARDAMPKGGVLTIETTNIEVDSSYTRLHLGIRPGTYVMLTVSDTGQGMEAADLNHIFEPFFTTKEQGKGTGLGLATVYGIVQQSGGAIWVYSEVDHGTMFKIYLPRTDAPLEAAAPTNPTTSQTRASGTVLLVEDEAMVRELVAETLQRAGYTVIAAPNGAAALERYAQQPSIDLLISDVVMPQMNGPELAERLIAQQPSLKVLFISGYNEMIMTNHGIPTASTTLLQKPFTPNDLLQKVAEILSLKP
ncbi:MAG: response regulator [Herpetosiphonaceae bacterium]|nr:response regulator [Herpetosiphonaceae bacterium]